MITLRVGKDGNVAGDVNNVAAYANEKRSKPIRVLHPDFPQAVHIIKYHQGHLDAFEVINRDDLFSFVVHDSGPVRCQYIAQDRCNGQTIFASRPFMLIVGKALDNHCDDPIPELPDYCQLQSEINNLTRRLQQVGILPVRDRGIIANCNQLLLDGESILLEGSINTPEGTYKSNNQYLFRARIIDNFTIQVAQLLKKGAKAVFYRTGYAQNSNNYIWTEWEAISFTNNSGVTYTDDEQIIPFKPGQLIVSHIDSNYCLYYDTDTGTSKNDRVMLCSDASDSRNIVNVTDTSYFNYTYTIKCDDIQTPYSGMICIFTPSKDMLADETNFIKFNEDVSAVYVKTGSGGLAVLDKPVLRQDVPTMLIYSNSRWIACIQTTSVPEKFQKLLDVYDFDNDAIKDEFIPDTVERVCNKVSKLSDDTEYSDKNYPSAEATKSYVSDKVSESDSIWTYRK